MRVAVTGASGFVGSALGRHLTEAGHECVPARRGASGALRWDTRAGFEPPDALSGFDAVVHLAGESIAGGRWTDARKREIRRSRVEGTEAVVRGLQAASARPRVLVSASAIGYYGDRGDARLDEDTAGADDFLGEVVRQWEDQTHKAAALEGVRAVCMRFGVILGTEGGALPRLLPPFRLGLGGRLGSGEQYMSWVHIEDVAGALVFALEQQALQGACNVTAPNPVTNREFTRTLGRVLSRPTPFGVPKVALRLALGEMATPLLLYSQRVEPRRLLEHGYVFRHPELEPALRDLLG